jgi:hypothetical protein
MDSRNFRVNVALCAAQLVIALLAALLMALRLGPFSWAIALTFVAMGLHVITGWMWFYVGYFVVKNWVAAEHNNPPHVSDYIELGVARMGSPSACRLVRAAARDRLFAKSEERIASLVTR